MKRDVLVCTLICRRTSYVLDLFLANQQEIQQAYPSCSLIFATDEPDYVPELKGLFNRYQLKGDVITYETVKPDYSKSRIWSIACGREALRQYTVSHNSKYLLFLDSDMTYDPSVIDILKSKIVGYDAVLSGYRWKSDGSWGFGAGCILINNKVLHNIHIRIYEFRNGQVIPEDEIIEMDLYKMHARINRGIFLRIKHFRDRNEYLNINPETLKGLHRVTNSLLARYIVFRISILVKRNIGFELHSFLSKTFRGWAHQRENTTN